MLTLSCSKQKWRSCFLAAVMVICVAIIAYRPANSSVSLYRGQDFESSSPSNVSDVSERAVIEKFGFLSSGYRDISWGIDADERIVGEEIERQVIPGTDSSQLLTGYHLEGLSVQTLYTPSKNISLGPNARRNVKQLISLKNSSSDERILTFRTKNKISASHITWMGLEKEITDTPLSLRASTVNQAANPPQYEGASLTFTVGRETAVYDWSDVQSLKHEVLLYREGGGSVVELVLRDLHVPAHGELIIDPNYSMTDSSSYDLSYSGSAEIEELGHGVLARDVNGDGVDDSIVYARLTDYNGQNSGSIFVKFGGGVSGDYSFTDSASYNIRYDGIEGEIIPTIDVGDVNGDGKGDLLIGSRGLLNDGGINKVWVIFSTLIDDVGATTGNLHSLSDAANYNIRIDGAASGDDIATIFKVGDINTDGLDDLLLGAGWADNSGSNTGSIWAIFSTLIDDVGLTTGNVLSLASSTSYNIRYDGAADGDNLSDQAGIVIGDVDNDGFSDLLLGARGSDNDGSNTGSVWLIYSSLVDDIGTSTGNVFSLADPANYNVRYDSANLNIGFISYSSNISDLNGDGQSDLALLRSAGGNNYAHIIFSNLIIPFGSSTGNVSTLLSAANYNIRYQGAFGINLGDINGDGLADLVIRGGSVWACFSTLIDDVGLTTGNDFLLSDTSRFNVRYDEAVILDSFGSGSYIKDVNSDGLTDLLILAPVASTSGTSTGHGAVYVIFSTLIDDLGTTTGNIKSMAVGGNYNIQYRGTRSDDELSSRSFLSYSGNKPSVDFGDLDGDGNQDILVSAYKSDINGFDAGSVWFISSTKVDDVGLTTGNIFPLNPGAYTARFDGEKLAPNLLWNGAMATGDLNGDGVDDLAMASPYALNGGVVTGSVYVVFGGGGLSGDQSVLNPTHYNIRYDGPVADNYLADDGALAISDVNGDGLADLLIGCKNLSYNTSGTGSLYVIFSTLIDDVGSSTGNVKDLSNPANYNIRYDGAIAWGYLTEGKSLLAGDVNGDGLNDLLLGTYKTGYNGANSGSLWVMFSTLIDDVGLTTGNNLSLSVAGNYNIRFDGPASGLYLGMADTFEIGDVDGDSFSDLILSINRANNNGANSGSVYLVKSTLIDDVGLTTGNVRNLANGSDYNVRFDGPAANYRLHVYAEGDVNGDNLSDLIMGKAFGSSNLYLAYSSIISDTGSTVGNNLQLSSPTNYNVMLDNTANIYRGEVVTGDLNNDGFSDLAFLDYPDPAKVIFSTILDDYSSSTGNVLDMNLPESYSVRFAPSGSVGSDVVMIADADNDGKEDLLLGGSGSLWIVDGVHFEQLPSPTGNVLDFDNPSDYSLRFEGYSGGRLFGSLYGGTLPHMAVIDMDGDSKLDLVLPAADTWNNSGKVYVVYGGDYFTLSGQVTIDGEPVAGATVSLGSLGSVTTDASGNYSVPFLRNGISYTLTPSKTGHTFTPASTSGVIVSDIVADFTATAPRYSISGQVLEAGVPVAGVLIDGGDIGVTYTDGSGSYSFSNVIVGEMYELRPQRAGALFFPDAIRGELTGNVIQNFTVQPENSAAIYRWGATSISSSYSWIYGLDVAAGGSIITSGDFDGSVDFDFGPGTDNISSAGYNDMFATRIDSDGGYLGTISAGDGGGGNTYLDNYDVVSDGAGNSYIVGGFDDDALFDIGGANEFVAIQGWADGYITKYNADNSYAWTKTFGGEEVYVYTAATDAANNLYVAGQFYGTNDFDPGPGVDSITSIGNSDAFVSLYDAGGNYLGTKVLVTDTDAYINSLKVDSLGNISVTGAYYGTIDLDTGAGTVDYTSAGESDIFVAKYSSAWTLIWSQSLGGVDFDRGAEISIEDSQYVYLTGTFSGVVDFNPGPALESHTSAGGTDAYVSCYLADGTYLWTRTFGGVDDDYASGLGAGVNGLVYLAGSFASTVDFDPSGAVAERTSAGGSDIFLVAFDSAGDYQWVHTIGGVEWDSATTLAIGPDDGSIYLGGGFGGSFDFNPASGVDIHSSLPSTTSHFVIKFDPPQATVTLSGTVIINGVPLSGVTVNAGSLGTFMTNNSGQFSIAGVVEGSNYSLTISKSGYSFNPASFSGIAIGNVDFSITATAANFRLSGRVISDTLDTYGIAGATVTNGTVTTTSDANGYFSLSGLGAGVYTIHASKDGFVESEALQVTLNADSTGHELRMKHALDTSQFTYWNGFLSGVNILELQNHGSERLGVMIKLYDADGVKKSETAVSVPPFAQKDVVVNDLTGFAADSYGQLQIQLSKPDFSGRLVVYRLSESAVSGEYDFVYALPFANSSSDDLYLSYNSYYPGSYPGATVKQWLSVANMSPTSAEYRVRTYGGGGEIVRERTIMVPGNGRRDIDGGDGGVMESAGMHQVTPLTGGNRYQALLVRYGTRCEGAASTSYDYALPVVGRLGTDKPQYVAFETDAGRTNWLEITNVLPEAVLAEIEGHDRDGSAIGSWSLWVGAKSQQHVNLNSLLSGVENYGFLAIRANRDNALLADSTFYFADRDNEKVDSAYIAPASEFFGVRQATSYNSFLEQNNWLELSNISSSPQNITLTVTGSSVFDDAYAASMSLSLAPYASRIVGLNPSADVPVLENQYGTVEVETTNAGAVTVGLLRHRALWMDMEVVHDFTAYIAGR